MRKYLLHLLGHKVAGPAIAAHTRPGGALDVKFGFALLRDRRVPIGAKLLALGLGAGITAALLALELPIEAPIALLFPLVGIFGDTAIDGLEVVAGPLFIAALLLPRLIPAPLAEKLRAERVYRNAKPV